MTEVSNIFVSPSSKFRDISWLGHVRFLPNPFQFISHPIIPCCTVYMLPSSVNVTLDGVFDCILDLLITYTTNNYSAIANFHTLQITSAHAKYFPVHSVFITLCLVTASNNSYSSTSGVKSSPNGGSLPSLHSSKSKSKLLYD
jgi:hypothetical protein